jgi:large subunit ribosomal protein L31e
MAMAKLERIYTVPLGDAYETVRNKRVPRAVKILRAFIMRHMKTEGADIRLSENLNKHIWARSIQKPPRRVKVRLIKDDGVVRAYLSDEKVEEPKKAAPKAEAKKEEKREAPKAEAKKEERKADEKPAPAARPPEARAARPEAAPSQVREKKEAR